MSDVKAVLASDKTLRGSVSGGGALKGGTSTGGGTLKGGASAGGIIHMTGYATEKWVQEGYQPKGEYLTEVPEGYAKTEDIPAKPEDIGAQPAGSYLTEVPAGYATEEYVRNKITEVDLSGYAQKSELPTKVSQLQNDAGYLTEHQDISGKLDASALPSAVNTALAQAKASGEFDGKDGQDGSPGKDGADGYTPVKGVDYFDGKDGSPGKDGAAGKDGSPGKDGVSATHSWNGTTLTITSASGTSSADLKGDKGDTGAAGSAGKDGSNGKDGVSATHSWNGTTLTVTSASGTSSANLKGEKGDKGDTGGTGAAGTSVTVKSVSESTEDGGSNVVTFSDGKTLTVKNGSKGSTGAITPQMYGAKGDGVTDDTAAFKNALAENDSVFVPSGSYVISDTIDISRKKSLYSDDGQRATILYGGSNSVVLVNRMSVFRNINITIKNAFTGIVFDVNNRGNITNANGGSSRVEHSTVKFETKSPNATLIGITADSGADANNIPTQAGICFQTFHDINVDSSGKGYGYGIKMELIQGRAFTEATSTGFPWITHIDYDDIYLGQPQTAIKALVTNTSGAEHFNRINMGNILFNNVYTQFRAGDTEKFLDVEYFGGYFTKCTGWDYHPLTNAGEKVNVIGEGVTACFNDCSMNFGKDFLQTCDFTAETEYTVADNPEYFINKYFNGTVLSQGYDTIDAKIQAKLNDEYIGNITDEKINDVLYSGYANVLDDPLTQIKDRSRFSNSSQSWSTFVENVVLIIPAVNGGNIIRWTPSEYKLSNGYQSVFFFNDDQLTDGILIGEHSSLWVEEDGGGYLKIDNPSGHKYIAIPFYKRSIVDSYDTPITLDTLADMVITINREITGNEGKSYTEYLRESVINPAIAEEFGKVTIPTKTSQLTNDSGFLTQHQSLSGYAKTADHYTKTEADGKYQPKGSYLTSVPSEYVTETELAAKKYLTAHQDISGKADKSSAETWTFTLADGSTVTKRVVLA